MRDSRREMDSKMAAAKDVAVTLRALVRREVDETTGLGLGRGRGWCEISLRAALGAGG